MTSWSDKLDALLREADQVAQSNDLDLRLTVIRKLSDFVVESSPNTPEVLALDAIAQAARRDLTCATLEQRVNGISARTREFATLRAAFAALAGDARNSADTIDLTQTQKVVADLNASVASLQALNAALRSDQHPQLAAKIASALAGLQDLRSDLQKLA
jgi:hypothetical protein